jgi:hypothetical protein
MLYYEVCPLIAWPSCPYYRFQNQRIEDLASPIQVPDNTNGQSSLFPQKILLEEATIHPALFSISYPYVSNAENSEVKAQINNSIIAKVDDLFRNSIMLPEKLNFEEIAEFYKVPLNEKGLLSILFGLYTYTGGAHGSTVYNSLTIDLESGRIYEFSDLFNSKMNFTAFLNELIIKEIKQKQIPLINEFKGIEYNQQFYLTPVGLVIYYQIYEYTPYAHGLFEIIVPYSDISNILSPLSPIHKLI